jgi:hypothetical protein
MSQLFMNEDSKTNGNAVSGMLQMDSGKKPVNTVEF